MPRPDKVPTGHRDHRVPIEQLVESTSDSGFPIETWEPFTTVYARKEDVSARERFSVSLAQEAAPYDTRWAIPWIPAMNPERVDVPKRFRLVVYDRVQDIVGAREIQRQDGIELTTLTAEQDAAVDLEP